MRGSAHDRESANITSGSECVRRVAALKENWRQRRQTEVDDGRAVL